MSRIVVVTGTDTGVGKTVATAALAVHATARGSVAVVKPVQTGVGAPDDAPADVEEVRRLAGADVETVELARLAEPLAPETAARRSGATLPTIAEHAAHVHEVATRYDTVIVEGAGGLLVRLDGDGGTLLDLAAELAAEVVVVTRSGLGTLNHTELTVRALRDRGIEPAGLVIGAWPERPDLAERCNLEDLPRVTGVPLLAVLPGGAGKLSADAFAAGVPGWFSA